MMKQSTAHRVHNPFPIVLFSFVLAGCAHTNPVPSCECVCTTPTPTKGDFIDQVLEPLSMRLAEEKYAQTRADANHRCAVQASEGGLAMDAAKALPGLRDIARVGEEKLERAKQEHLAWLETRRIPLKQGILNTLVTQTEQTDSDFTVCVDGRKRHYTGLKNGRFTRLDDEGSCAVPELGNLTLPKNQVVQMPFVPPPCYQGN